MTTKPIKLVAVDIDGTLLRSDKTPAPRGAAILKQIHDDGVHVVLATARRFESVHHLSERLGITTEPIICSDGARIHSDATGRVWRTHTMPLSVAQQIAELADKNDWQVTMVIDGETYLKARRNQPLGRLPDGRHIVENNRAMLRKSIPPMRMLAHQPQAIQGICDWYDTHDVVDTVRFEYFYNLNGNIRSCGLFPANADKGTGLQFVCKKLNVPINQTVAIGDNANDMPMFRAAEVSIAMGNAIEDAKRTAQHIAPSNDDEGVAWAIEKFVLRR